MALTPPPGPLEPGMLAPRRTTTDLAVVHDDGTVVYTSGSVGRRRRSSTCSTTGSVLERTSADPALGSFVSLGARAIPTDTDLQCAC